jgi:hypothetical protein
MAKSTGENITSVLGGQIRTEDAKGRLIVSKNNLDTLLLGQNDAGNVVVKLAKPGYDVKTATNDQLILNSEQNVFKIVATGYITIPSYTVVISNVAGGYVGQSSVVTYAHGLGYRPGIMSFVESATYSGTDGTNSFTPVSQIATPLYLGSPGGFSVTTNNIYVENVNVIARGSTVVYVGGSGYGGTVTIASSLLKYYLLQESSN